MASKVLTAAAAGTTWQPPFVANNGHVEDDDDPWAVPDTSGPQAASAKVTTPVMSPAADSGTTIVGEIYDSSGAKSASPAETKYEPARSSWGHLADYDFAELLKDTESYTLSDGGVFNAEKQKVVYQFAKNEDHYSLHQNPEKLFWNPKEQAWTKYSVHCAHGPI